MTTPFYVAPEQMMKDRADFARKGIARGRALVAVVFADGIALVAENPSNTLRKISEIYDRIAFAGVGKYNEFDQLRVAGVRAADLKGYQYSRDDVDARSLANNYAQILGQIFTHEVKPMEIEILVAEVGIEPTDDQLFHIMYDGTVVDERRFSVLGGDAEAIAARGLAVHVAPTVMRSRDDRIALAESCLAFAQALAGAVMQKRVPGSGVERLRQPHPAARLPAARHRGILRERLLEPARKLLALLQALEREAARDGAHERERTHPPLAGDVAGGEALAGEARHVGLDDVQGRGRGCGRVEGIAAIAQDARAGRCCQRMGRRHHSVARRDGRTFSMLQHRNSPKTRADHDAFAPTALQCAMRRLEFGWFLPTAGDTTAYGVADSLVPPSLPLFDKVVQAAEAAGFEYMLVPVQTACWEAWISSAMMVARSKSIRMLVAARPSYINPVLLAKMIAAFDRLSGGRVCINLIAGQSEAENASEGIKWGKEERYEIMDEEVSILKALWTQNRVDYDGKFYQLKGAQIRPHPLQKPHPRFYLGGGSQQAWEISAKHSDVHLFWGDTYDRIRANMAEPMWRQVPRAYA